MSDLEKHSAKDGGHDPKDEGLISFFPLHMMKEIMVMLGILAALLVLASFFPAHLKAPADAFNTPQHIKPEWYFLAAYQALKYFPAGEIFSGFSYVNLGILIINGSVLILFIIPFVDKYQGKAARKRPFFLALGIFAVCMIIILIYLGHYSGYTDPIFHTVFK